MTYDLIVVGAGPAGCSTAITASANGARVLLLERGSFPRHKVCGEFVSAESLELLAALLTPGDGRLISNAPRIGQGRIFSDGTKIAAEINPPAASITRFALDAALWRACLQRGVDAHANCSVKAVKGAGPFFIETETETFHAEAVVNATGRWSNLTARASDARGDGEQRIGLKAHFREPASPPSVDLYFFEGGYCGVQPITDESGQPAVNACAMVSARCAKTMTDVLQLNSELQERSRHWIPLTQPVTTSPLIFHEPTTVNAGMLQVGDAATFVDPFVGDGISLALRSGALAAQCLTTFFAGRASLEQATVEYDKRYLARLSHVFRASSVLRRILGWPAVVRRPLLTIVQKTPGISRRLVRMTR